ncbi:MAG: LysM peptidoglycan-binding domain-containing protein, partial [bacterium]
MEIYVARAGDSVYRVARRLGVEPEELIYWNQLQNPEVLAVGQALFVPGRERRHTVRRGESLYSIARAYDVSLQRLIAANPQLRDPAHIRPGEVITIPAGNASEREVVVNGYMTGGSMATMRETLPWLTFLSPFSFQVDARGGLTKTFSFSPALSAGYRTANLLTVANLQPDGGFSSDIAHAILTDETVQNTFLGNLETQLSLGGYYGVNLDFEYVYPFDRENYNRLVARLADRLHLLGYTLVTALAPKTSDAMTGLLYAGHDYAFHGRVADYVILMTYEWGYSRGPAMAVAPLDKVKRVLDYAVSVMPAGKILMGVPNYGYDWKLPFVPGSVARALTNVQAVTLAGQVRAAIRYDEAAQSPFFRYVDGDGAAHEVWFEDAR